ncbi:Substrate-binding protein [Rhodococcus sp. RD6.2]|uniref:lipocalin family protein n=1 Tax=Rhodococcus sp. RD6.2 TaxID=260936 RepID=UPI00063B2969|nr:lipocalin family protein [Rhodococcus sp. RD6.2]CRK51161.1 Substrate-binding protein [Rhodococcus sp. RD6.2]
MNWTRRIAATIACCAAALPLAGTVAAQAAPWAPLTPVERVDLPRYLGTWHQLAANPAPFNLDCVRDTTANYSLVDDNDVRVENSCTTVTGDRRGIVGNARVNGPAELHVSFPSVPGQSSPDGPSNYLVAHIADDYSWALVGDPNRLSGFVLSRTPVVDAAGWQEIRRVVEAQGYNSCLMLTSPTTEGLQDIRPLCMV